MPSLNYNRGLEKVARATIDLDSDTFKCMLVTAAYTPDKDAHEFRSDVTGEATGDGYTAGGAAVTLTVTRDDANDRIDVTVSDPSWPSATITARAAVIYKDTGAAGTSPLLSYVDFGSDFSSTNGTFTVTFTAPLRFQN